MIHSRFLIVWFLLFLHYCFYLFGSYRYAFEEVYVA